MKSRLIWIVVLVVALLGAGWWGVVALRPAPVTYKTTPVDRGDVVSKVAASGTLSALVTVQVGSQVSGRLQKLYVDYNSTVKKGQLLATLDPQMFQATLEREEANNLAAKSSIRKAQVERAATLRQLTRSKYLAEHRLIALADLEAAQAAADAAQAQVESAIANQHQAEANLRQARVNLDYTTIASPVDGVVISRTVDVGQTVAASLQAPTLFVIAQDLTRMQVDTSVSEADIGQLQPGMAAEFRVDAFPEETFKGTIRQIRNAAQTQQNIVTYDAVVDVENPDLKLRPGMTANVSFISAEHPNVLRVPNAALRFQPPFAEGASASAGAGRGDRAGGGARMGAGDPSGGGERRRRHGGPGGRGKAVWVLKDGKPQRVRVKTGLTDGSFTEITGGELEEGAPVVVDTDAPVQARPQQRQRQQGLPRSMG